MNRVVVIMSWVVRSAHRTGHAVPFRFCERTQHRHIDPAFPAVTCTAQSDYATGKTASEHGIVGNGWHNRFGRGPVLKQPNQPVQGPKVWDTCANAMRISRLPKCFGGTTCTGVPTRSLTPRPMYPADGRKVFDIYTQPASIRTRSSGTWGVASGILGPAAGTTTRRALPIA